MFQYEYRFNAVGDNLRLDIEKYNYELVFWEYSTDLYVLVIIDPD